MHWEEHQGPDAREENVDQKKTFKQIDSKCDVEYDGLVVQLSGALYGLLQAGVSLPKHSNGKFRHCNALHRLQPSSISYHM